MAFIKENPFFTINGKIGKYVVRKFNGKKVITCRPTHYKKTKCKQALANRNKFSIVSWFAKQVNSNPVLSAIWKESNIKGFSAYHKIIKANMRYVTEDGLSVLNIIVPPASYNFAMDISLHNNLLVYNLNGLHIMNCLGQNNQLQLILVFSFINSPKPKIPEYDLKFISRSYTLENGSDISSFKLYLSKTFLISLNAHLNVFFFHNRLRIE